jgi:serine/threonine-protein kinase
VHWARLFARLITREPVLALMEQTLDAFLLLSSSPRWRALVLQIAFEIEAGRDTDRARKRLASLADAAFIDLEWLEHCPALDDYKDDGAYRALHKATRSRVKAAWGRTIS